MFAGKAFTGPLKLLLDITDKCDMRCIMCWHHSPSLRNEGSKAPRFFPLERFEGLVKELKSIGTKTILLCGEGEPLLHPGIEEMAQICARHSMEIEIMTNAYHLGKEKISLLKKTGLKKISVSLHASDLHTFGTIRPLEPEETFARIMENLLLLKSARLVDEKPLFFIINVISSLNYHDVHGMIKLAENLNIDKILFKPLKLAPDLPQYLSLSNDTKKNLINKLLQLSKKTSISNNIKEYINTMRSPDGNQKHFSPMGILPCHIPWTHSVINIDGNVVGCAYARKHALGNIHTSSFGDIWFGKEYDLFRKAHLCPENCIGKAVYPLTF